MTLTPVNVLLSECALYILLHFVDPNRCLSGTALTPACSPPSMPRASRRPLLLLEDPCRQVQHVLPGRGARVALAGGKHEQPAAGALLSRTRPAGVRAGVPTAHGERPRTQVRGGVRFMSSSAAPRGYCTTRRIHSVRTK